MVNPLRKRASPRRARCRPFRTTNSSPPRSAAPGRTRERYGSRSRARRRFRLVRLDGRRERVGNDLEGRAALVALFLVLVFVLVSASACGPIAVVAPGLPWVWLERDPRDVEVAVADVADRQRPLGPPAEIDAAEVARAGDGKLAARRVAGHRERSRPARIVARDGERRGLRSEARGLEADLRVDGAAGGDGKRYASTPGGMNSGEEEEMSVTVRGQPPLLRRVSGWSLNDPTHTSPKFPALATVVASRDQADPDHPYGTGEIRHFDARRPAGVRSAGQVAARPAGRPSLARDRGDCRAGAELRVSQALSCRGPARDESDGGPASGGPTV
jgi:hypothetical protein